MKKYFLNLIAIFLVVGLSAYKIGLTPNNNKDLVDKKINTTILKSSKAEMLEEALYWYVVKSNGEIDHTQLINQSPLTKTQLRNGLLIPCEEAPGEDCLRGFFMQQTSDVSDAGIDVVEKTED